MDATIIQILHKPLTSTNINNINAKIKNCMTELLIIMNIFNNKINLLKYELKNT